MSKFLSAVIAAILFIPISLFSELEYLKTRVISKIPHALPAFTQGLAIDRHILYESAGLYGKSSVRGIDLNSGKILVSYNLESHIFAEGLALLPGRIVLISWKNRQAYIFDMNGFRLEKTLSYSGEGWGLCRDGSTVWMSNGSSSLTQRDPITFIPLKILPVTYKGKPLQMLNDLECVGNVLYANVWGENWIARINKSTGVVDGIIDASGLLTEKERELLNFQEVLNGIAFRPQTNTFYVTGKEWPWIFEVQFVPK